MDFVFGLGRSLTRMVRTAAGRIMGKSSNGEYEQPKYTFWDTIEEFGYHFNEEGKLVDNDGGGYKFFVKEGDRHYNQQHYDALGELVTEYLYNKMETDLGLQKIFIPVDAEKAEPQGFVFTSPQAMQGQKLMVVINGAGVVRAGQWSRKLIINEGIEVGSQFPYIRRARDAGFEVVVLNTNQNQQVINGKTLDIRGSETAEDHGVYVWEHIIRQAKAKAIVVVAHSYGGIVTCNMVEQFLEDFKERVFCIVFTDSVHTVGRDQWSSPARDFLKERAVNFASTYVPLDYMMQASSPDDCLSVSAGTEEHERTSHACIDSAFCFILSNHASWTANRSMAPHHFMPLPDDPSKVSSNRWSRTKGKEGKEEEASDPADAPSASGTGKRNAADVEEAAASASKNGGRGPDGGKSGAMKDEEVLSKNGERGPDRGESGAMKDEEVLSKIGETGPDRGKSGAMKDEEVLSKNGERGPEKETTGSVKDEESLSKVEERSPDGTKTESETESEAKPEVTSQGENVTLDTAVKAEVKQEAGHNPEAAASSPKAAEDPDHEDTRVKQEDTDRGDKDAEGADNQRQDTESETKGLDSKVRDTSSESKEEREKST